MEQLHNKEGWGKKRTLNGPSVIIRLVPENSSHKIMTSINDWYYQQFKRDSSYKTLRVTLNSLPQPNKVIQTTVPTPNLGMFRSI